jgi:hypothetical protein
MSLPPARNSRSPAALRPAHQTLAGSFRSGDPIAAPPVFGALTVGALSARFESQKSARSATGI